MASRLSLRLRDLEKILKRLLKKYETVHDFVIFGSAVKATSRPGDTDIAVILEKKDAHLIGEIHNSIAPHAKEIHLQILTYEDFLKSKLPYAVISEGYSVKSGKFLADSLDVKKQFLYWFDLLDLPQNRKAMFSKGLRNVLKNTTSLKVGKGAVLVPANKSGEFEDFFNEWKRKVKKKEFLEV